MDAVSEILVDRSREADKFSRMVIVSLVIHGVILSALAFIPSRWDVPATSENVIEISFGGPEGPMQGRNMISAKPIEEAVPVAKPRGDTRPAAAKPEMVLPTKPAKVEPTSTKPKPAETARVKPPSQGAEVKQGVSRADTQGASVPFGGLSTGGGGDNGVTTNLANFCCPEYLLALKRAIYANWRRQAGQPGLNSVKFVVVRDGTITDVAMEKSAGQFLDLASQRAVQQTQRLPPLPAAYTAPTLTVYLEVEYIR